MSDSLQRQRQTQQEIMMTRQETMHATATKKVEEPQGDAGSTDMGAPDFITVPRAARNKHYPK